MSSCDRPREEENEKGIKPLLGKRGIFILDAAVLLTVAFAFPMVKLLLALPIDCYAQSMGYLCPACGGTRAALFLLQGDIWKAFSMNPYFFLTGLVAVVGIGFLHLSCFTGSKLFHKLSRGLFHPYTAVAWAVGFLIFGFLRNVL